MTSHLFVSVGPFWGNMCTAKRLLHRCWGSIFSLSHSSEILRGQIDKVTLKWTWLWAMFGVRLARNTERALYIGLLKPIKHIFKNSHVNRQSLYDWCFSVRPTMIGCHIMSFCRQMTNVSASWGKLCYSTFVRRVCACSEFLWRTCTVRMCTCTPVPLWY